MADSQRTQGREGTDFKVMQAAAFVIAAALLVLVIAEAFSTRSPRTLRINFGLVGAGVGLLAYAVLRLWLRWRSKNWLSAGGGALLTVAAFAAVASTAAAVYHAATYERPSRLLPPPPPTPPSPDP